MPFTFAHPLAVLPLGIKKIKYFDLTALIIGSMAPDFEYFIHFKPYQLYGHTLLGQLYYNLPLVIIVSLIYHYILKESIIINLPFPYCARYYNLVKQKWRINSIRRFIIVAYSALIGMITHLIWDSFTHIKGFFVTKLGILSSSVSILDFDIPIYKILQHGSTVIGLSIILLVLLKLQEKKLKIKFVKVSRISKIVFWMNILVVALLVELIILFLTNDFSPGRVIVSFINGGFIGLIITSLIDKRIRLTKELD